MSLVDVVFGPLPATDQVEVPTSSDVQQLVTEAVRGDATTAASLATLGRLVLAFRLDNSTQQEDSLTQALVRGGALDAVPDLLAGDEPLQVCGVAVLSSLVRAATAAGRQYAAQAGRTKAVEGLSSLVSKHCFGPSPPCADGKNSVARGDDPADCGSMTPDAEFLFDAVVCLSKIASRHFPAHPRMLERGSVADVLLQLIKTTTLPPALRGYGVNALFNLSRNPLSRQKLVQLGALEPLLHISQEQNPAFRGFAAAMAVANLAGDAEENAKLIETTEEVLRQVLEAVAATLKHERYMGSLWRLDELFMSLQSMASNDKNKEVLFKANILDITVQVLSAVTPLKDALEQGKQGTFSVKVWGHGAELLYKLAFSSVVADGIRKHEEVLALVKAMAEAPDSDAKKSAKGLLFLLDEKQSKDGSGGPRKSMAAIAQHIMLSYSWAEQSIVLRIADELKERGYPVWLDVDQMQGSTLEAMALAVEGAAVVCVCVSASYKDSNNCRLEAEYAFNQKVKVVPLLVQNEYRATGWLGALLGSKLWYDFSSAHNFDATMDALVRELADSVAAAAEHRQQPRSNASGDAPSSGASERIGPSMSQAGLEAKTWSVAQVCAWLTEQGFRPQVAKAFNSRQVSGRVLAAMMHPRATPLDQTLRAVGITQFHTRFELVDAITTLFEGESHA
eukprot:m.55773 g.55773  ORF g.55773 m.55773 type:complete len:677 (+) comp12553_c0_seq2:228-2258(+)